MNPLPSILIAALFFSAWPIIAKFSNLGVGWLSLVIATGTGLIALTQVNHEVPLIRQLLIGIAAGLVNGIGTLAYAKLLNTKGVDVSKFIPLILGLIVVFTVVAGIFLFKEPLSIKKVTGVLLVVIAIFLLN